MGNLGKNIWPHIEIANKFECQGEEHLERFFQDILDQGGEGVILRDPTSAYQAGRSSGFLKHKVPVMILLMHMFIVSIVEIPRR